MPANQRLRFPADEDLLGSACSFANANGHNERALLPADSLDYTPSFSADGKWIVFTSERNGSADIFGSTRTAAGWAAVG